MGVNGHIFTLYKFRSMYVDAEGAHGSGLGSEGRSPHHTLGKWLRRLRLDELPQFWNVVKGEMVDCGAAPGAPRVCRRSARSRFPYYRQRLAVKPGITGWAQINHKYGDTQLDAMIKLEYDLYYIKNMSRWHSTFTSSFTP